MEFSAFIPRGGCCPFPSPPDPERKRKRIKYASEPLFNTSAAADFHAVCQNAPRRERCGENDVVSLIAQMFKQCPENIQRIFEYSLNVFWTLFEHLCY